MKLPKSLRISGLRYSVQPVGNEDMVNDGVMGECDYTLQRIRVLEVLHPQTFRTVLWHEIGEAVKIQDTLEMDHETMTVAFNKALEVLDNNPALRSYLWGGK